MTELNDDENIRRHTRFDLSALDAHTLAHQRATQTLAGDSRRGPSSPTVPRKSQKSPTKYVTKRNAVVKSPADGLRPLHLARSMEQLPPRLLKYKSPWKYYKWISESLQEEDKVIKARELQSDKIFALRAFPIEDFDHIERRFNGLRHENILTAKGFFREGNRCFVLSDTVYISLIQIVACPYYPTEKGLACIIGQILRGIVFLFSKGILYKSLACSKILLDEQGHVKIVGFTDTEIYHRDLSLTPLIRNLSLIMNLLMEKLPRNQGGVNGVSNLDRWPMQSSAFQFLLKLDSAGSFADFTDHAFIDPTNWDRYDLVELIDRSKDKTLLPIRGSLDEISDSEI